MIRFVPDGWLEAVLRPVAIATPDGGVYVETVAPDFRFVFALLLLACVLLLYRRGNLRSPRTWALFGFCSLAFVPWLATTGNGRYFMAVFLLVGPLCVALLAMLPVTRQLRLGLLALMLLLQVFLVRENTPWGSWGLAPWREAPAFAVDVPQEMKDTPATYITATSISWSLIAPSFHPDSRWINLTSQRGDGDPGIDSERTRRFLAAAKRMYLLFPGRPGDAALREMPPDLVASLDDGFAGHGLRLAPEGGCRFALSRGLTSVGIQEGKEVPAAAADQRGFWICPLLRIDKKERDVRPAPPPEVEAVYEKLERMCPRMFGAGQGDTAMLPVGARRFYVESDMRLYVLNDGIVMYKYMRALNPVRVGTVKEVLADGFRMQCDNIRGRGLPWDREI